MFDDEHGLGGTFCSTTTHKSWINFFDDANHGLIFDEEKEHAETYGV